MRYNQLLIVAIRPLFLSAVKRAVADRLMNQTTTMDSVPRVEHLKCCISAAVRNAALARHLSTLNGHRKTLHAGLHFIFHAAVCLILRPLVFREESSQDAAIAAMNDVDYGIQKMLEAASKGNTDGQRCAETLQELRCLVERLTAPVGHDPMLSMASSSALPLAPHLISQELPPPPMAIGDDPVLYDELVTWMGDDWPIYNSFVNE
jgi:hypothetical protein